MRYQIGIIIVCTTGNGIILGAYMHCMISANDKIEVRPGGFCLIPATVASACGPTPITGGVHRRPEAAAKQFVGRPVRPVSE